MRSILLDNNQIKKLKTEYLNFISIDSNVYIDFNINTPDLILTIYTSGSCVIKKDNCSFYKKKIKENNSFPIIGCDETGVGDILLPMVASAVYLDKNSLDFIFDCPFNITDSKKISDDNIVNIFNLLNKKLKHSTTILTNEQYNEMINRGFNSHMIKTFIHIKNISKFPSNISVIMDQFAKESMFNSYLKKLNLSCNHKIFFETKADSKFISVALASIFARYYLICEKKNLENLLGFKILYGASNDCVLCAEKIKTTQKKGTLNIFSKNHFKNISHLL